MTDTDWQPMSSAAQDGSQMLLYIPGACPITKDVVIGGWSNLLKGWALLPYGTTQPVALYPSRWAVLPAGPPAG